MQLVSGRAQRDKDPVPPDFHPALTVICDHITHGSYLASFQVPSFTFSGCLLTDHQPPPPAQTAGEQGTEGALACRRGHSHQIHGDATRGCTMMSFTCLHILASPLAVRVYLQVINALVQPSGFEVTGYLQNWDNI